MMEPRQTSNIHFNIRRITLAGLAPGAERRFTTALKARLSQLVSRSAVRDWSQVASLPHVNGAMLAAGSTPEQFAEHVASEIFNALAVRRGNHV